jgi:hypothetical protein
LYICVLKYAKMATKKKEAGLNAPAKKKKEVNYVIIDGKKHSRTWAAMLANKGTGTIVDMRAVLK